jgi:hypothetical protein
MHTLSAGSAGMSSFSHMEVREIAEERAERFILEYHYMKYLPQLNDFFLGGFIDGDLAAVMSLGWGVRPRHTIQKIFPELDTEDYRAIGRLCAVEELPKNTESHFIGKCISWLQQNRDFDVLFTWADGMLGKPGIIYQATNFWYAGHIMTDTYLTQDGEKVHPRQTNRIGGRPSWAEMQDLGWQHYRGMQLKYVYFLCDSDHAADLRESSPVQLRRGDYPKQADLHWKQRTVDGWVRCGKPDFDPEELTYNEAHRENYQQQMEQVSLEYMTTGQRFPHYEQNDDVDEFSLNTRN